MRVIRPSIGTDPEIFLLNANNRSRLAVPAEKFIQKGQDVRVDPRLITGVKVDNGALEMNPPPKHCLQELNSAIGSKLRSAKTFLGKGIKFSMRQVEQFSVEDIQRYTSLSTFGCAPSQIYSEGELCPTESHIDPFTERKRSAGYHIHIGGKINSTYHPLSPSQKHMNVVLFDPEYHIKLVQTCDLFVGLVGVLIDDSEDNRFRRLVMGYGRAGEFREQKHGFEYRVLPNFPLRHPTLAWIVHCLTRDAFYATFLNLNIFDKINMSDVEYAINYADKEAAMVLWVDLKNIMKEKVWARGQRIDYCNGGWGIGSTIMFREPELKNLEFFLNAFKISGKNACSDFTTINFQAWARGTGAPGLDSFVANKQQYQTDKKFKEFRADFNATWSILNDNLLRYINVN